MSAASTADFNAQIAGKLTANEVAAIAKARQAQADAMEAEAEKTGFALRRIHRAGVVNHFPPKRRAATSGCSRDARKDHGKMVAIP